LKEEYNPEYPLTKKVTTIGRLGDIQLQAEFVTYAGEGYDEDGSQKYIRLSRKHAKISIVGKQFILEDVGSMVGTYVNGQKLGSFQPDPWKARFCHSEDYYSKRKPQIIERNKGKAALKDGDRITFGQEMYDNQHEFIFRR
jgi:pSer/pThr/pTyr-binding forkhead associated (FHA) protein